MTPTEEACVEAIYGRYQFKEAYEAYGTGNCQLNLPPGFPKELLGGISTAAHVTAFADRVAFVKILQRHPKSSIRETDQKNSIHPLRKNINIVAMPTRDVLLRHFRKTYLYTRGYAVAHSYLLCTLGVS